MTKCTWEIMLNRHTYQIISSRGNTGETRKRLREQLKSVDRGSLVPARGAEGGAKGKVAEPPAPLRGLQVFDGNRVALHSWLRERDLGHSKTHTLVAKP